MLRSVPLFFLLVFSASVSADGFDYDFLSLGYGVIEFDDINVDGDGVGIAGSYAINDSFHVFAGYQDAGLDFGVDVTSISAGIGYHMGLSPTVDLVTSLSYEYVDISASGIPGIDDNGVGLGIGLRFAATDKIELNAGISYVDFSDSGDDTGFGAGGLYSFTDAFALGFGGSWTDDASAYTLTGRFYFGK